MKKSILEFWVGLFVLLGLGALGVLAFQVAGGKDFSGSTPSYTVYADFSDIGGLKPNAPVRVSGVLVGRVASIELDPKTYQARVALNINQQYTFSNDVSASILTSGLLGEQYIGLQQGGDPDDLAAGGTITITSSAMVLENLIGKFMTNFTGSKDNKTATEEKTE
ncbi:outer membrane lipid asymmetry maintenance protein MlaD [Alysiella filiformis]|uniref:Phospholipid/cholesterol/gamma-HCH transport system substrate-binding protein n=1 Tax=Alysiella filiformis DSM 16848 TaxID=1120981 RepID=A0A286EBS1_9NEIS|nr:outer membrane lipid asymmetry maintenance protein MlaD [Alysiella filiformis]QMT31333.1 outer membrane lipid asymmetry maintenance protein MlaD [Alysiella filiformis]UBQ55661.1 outer membrane lipid asymmetry maintenance protein MlaD [Alysiella filiformis DSM 16848]SOD68377.1 phospholipid/cholesterol/gamma-HCH transport system substrate-binding protein [Alysiella filiformis DSM 16848]